MGQGFARIPLISYKITKVIITSLGYCIYLFLRGQRFEKYSILTLLHTGISYIWSWIHSVILVACFRFDFALLILTRQAPSFIETSNQCLFGNRSEQPVFSTNSSCSAPKKQALTFRGAHAAATYWNMSDKYVLIQITVPSSQTIWIFQTYFQVPVMA